MKRTLLAIGVSTLLGFGMALVLVTATEGQSSPKGYVRDIPADPIPHFAMPKVPKRERPGPTAAEEVSKEVRRALAEADAAESEYSKAVDGNRKQAGTVPDAEVERLHRRYSDSLLLATSKQVKFLQSEVDRLSEQIQDLRTVKIWPASP